MSVIVYTTPTCGYCHQVKAYLSQRGVPFVEQDVSRDQQAAMEMVRLTGQQGVPVTLIDGQAVVGFDRPRLDHLLAQRSARPPKLGVSIADAEQIGAKKGLRLPQGAYVGRVKPGSAAALAGLHKGDVIVQLGGQAIQSANHVHQVMANVSHGQTLDLLVWRDGRTSGMSVRF